MGRCPKPRRLLKKAGENFKLPAGAVLCLYQFVKTEYNQRKRTDSIRHRHRKGVRL